MTPTHKLCFFTSSGKEHPWNDAFWAHETDAASVAIAKRAVEAGYTYGQARWWLARMCPRRGLNGTLDRITRRCYARGLRSLEETARPQPLPPPPPPQPEESPEDQARRRVVELLNMGGMIPTHRWPVKIVNPVIKSRLIRCPLGPQFVVFNHTRPNTTY